MMSGLEMGIVGFFILLTLLLIRIHISIAMFFFSGSRVVRLFRSRGSECPDVHLKRFSLCTFV